MNDTRYFERDTNSTLIRFDGPEEEMDKWVKHYNRLHGTPFELGDFLGHDYIGTPTRLSREERIQIAKDHNLPLMRMVNQAGFAVMFNGFQVFIRGRHYEISLAEQERVELAQFIKSSFKIDNMLELRGINVNDSNIEGGFSSPEFNAFERALKTGEGMEEVYTPAMLRLLYEEPDRAEEWQQNLDRHLKGEPILTQRYDDTNRETPEWLRGQIRLNTLGGNLVFFQHPQDREYMRRIAIPFLNNRPPRPLIDSPPEAPQTDEERIPARRLAYLAARARSMEEEGNSSSSSSSAALAAAPEEGQAVRMRREVGSQVEEEEGLCIACFERPIETMVLPCQHHVLCRQCSDRMAGTPNAKRCVFCRQDICEVLQE